MREKLQFYQFRDQSQNLSKFLPIPSTVKTEAANVELDPQVNETTGWPPPNFASLFTNPSATNRFPPRHHFPIKILPLKRPDFRIVRVSDDKREIERRVRERDCRLGPPACHVTTWKPMPLKLPHPSSQIPPRVRPTASFRLTAKPINTNAN